MFKNKNTEMSKVEELLIEAWNLGLKDVVIEKVVAKKRELSANGKWIDRDLVYEEAFKEAINENIPLDK
jgi:hypothetical protein